MCSCVVFVVHRVVLHSLCMFSRGFVCPCVCVCVCSATVCFVRSYCVVLSGLSVLCVRCGGKVF